MFKKTPTLKGKITYYNNITGIIFSNNKNIPFHKKDITHLMDNNLLNKYVEFNIENNSNIDYARNIKILEADNDFVKKYNK